MELRPARAAAIAAGICHAEFAPRSPPPPPFCHRFALFAEIPACRRGTQLPGPSPAPGRPTMASPPLELLPNGPHTQRGQGVSKRASDPGYQY